MKFCFQLFMFVFLLLYGNVYAQVSPVLFESSVVYGGVVGVGYGKNGNSGTLSASVYIPSGSTIKKAYLFAVRVDKAPDITVVLNNKNYTFNLYDGIITKGFRMYSNPLANNSAILYKDITTDIDASTSIYTLYIPPQPVVGKQYTHFYLYIIYEHPAMPKTHYAIYINRHDVDDYMSFYLDNLSPVNTTNPVGLATLNTFFCDAVGDCSDIWVNNDSLGRVGGADANSDNDFCPGTYANFAYVQDSLLGLDDDTPDSLMHASDALADIRTYLSNGDTDLTVTYIYTGTWGGVKTNPMDALFITYTSPCDTFGHIQSSQDTICYGDSVALTAWGGSRYLWENYELGDISPTALPEITVSPSKTTTYYCTIRNDSGCVVKYPIQISVVMPPKDSVIKATCGESNGKILTVPSENAYYPYSFTLFDTSQQVIGSNSSGVFGNLPSGGYILQSTAKGCLFTDTLYLPDTNTVTASFWRNPYQGQAPLTVELGNQSTGATHYIWQFPHDTFYSENLTYTFDSGGVYPVCLVAYNNIPRCSDTACYTFYIDDNTQLWLPNVFSPNGDGVNDNFMALVQDAGSITSLSFSVYNRWGVLLHRQEMPAVGYRQPLWDGTVKGKPATAGTYFYTIRYTLSGGKQFTLKGNVLLVR